MNWRRYTVHFNATIREALTILDRLGADAIIFAINDSDELLGSLTDGDIRRGLLKGHSIDEKIVSICRLDPRFIRKNDFSIETIKAYRNNNLKIVPVLENNNDQIVNVINFRTQYSLLPIDAVIMAGGEGRRLRPLTESIPKPLLKVGEKPIIEHTIDRLSYFGINAIWLSVNYLAEQIEEFAKYNPKSTPIRFIRENEPLGTIGSVSLIDDFEQDFILVSNSDLLTNVNYEDFFEDFVRTGADMSVVTIPYDVDIPYAVLDVEDGVIKDFKEKPTYTYFSNGGIYLIKRELLSFIPKNTFFSATDFMSTLINQGKKIHSFPHYGYWLDIGKHDDFKRAQLDVLKLEF